MEDSCENAEFSQNECTFEYSCEPRQLNGDCAGLPHERAARESRVRYWVSAIVGADLGMSVLNHKSLTIQRCKIGPGSEGEWRKIVLIEQRDRSQRQPCQLYASQGVDLGEGGFFSYWNDTVTGLSWGNNMLAVKRLWYACVRGKSVLYKCKYYYYYYSLHNLNKVDKLCQPPCLGGT